MKKPHLIPSLCFFLLPVITYGAAASTIEHVELYPSGAMVARSVALTEADLPEVTIEGLPSTLIPSSIQISTGTAEGVRLGGFLFLPRENVVEADDERTAELRQAVEELEESLDRLRIEREVLTVRTQHFRGLAQSISKSLQEEADADTFALAEKAWGKAESVAQAGAAQLAILKKEEKKLGIELQKVKKDLGELVGKLNRLSGVLKIEVAGSVGDQDALEIRYQVREGGWQPVHELRANPAAGTLEWVYKAQIRQNSGEDWKDVSVTLNSASALYAGGLPELNPLILNKVEVRPMAKARMALESSYDMVQAAPPPAEEAMPESTTTGFFMELPEPLTLESGESPVIRAAFTRQLKADYWSEAVPELSTDAWLMAGLVNELGWPILAGDSYCYIDDQLVARRWMPSYAAGEEVELSLGRNEKMKIERKERVKKQAEGGLIDKTKRHDIKYETTVENRMAVAHRIVLQDRFPIGRDNKIQVRTIQPKNVEPEEGTGIFKWERTLQPGGSDIMTTEFTVIYPAEWDIYPPL
ncbi:MAG: mucoidy inhibitor MuiA family protein [Puniceicoccaceae bacterium]